MVSVKPELKIQLQMLCSHFGTPLPSLRYNITDHGIYYPDAHVITLAANPGPRRPHDVSLLHEFSHYLAHMRTGKPQMHRKPFKDALWDVAVFWYSDPMLYPWHTDFTNVEKYAKRRTGDRPYKS